MTLVVYNARGQVFVQECAYLFLIAALRQKQNIALHLLLVFLKMGSIYHSFSFFSKVIPKIIHNRVLQTIQMKLIFLCVWAEPAVLGSAKTALKFKYEIEIG